MPESVHRTLSYGKDNTLACLEKPGNENTKSQTNVRLFLFAIDHRTDVTVGEQVAFSGKLGKMNTNPGFQSRRCTS